MAEAMAHVPKMAVLKKRATGLKRPASKIASEDSNPKAPAESEPKVSLFAKIKSYMLYSLN